MSVDVYKGVLSSKLIEEFLGYYSVKTDHDDDRPDVSSKHPAWNTKEFPTLQLANVLDSVLDLPYSVEQTIFYRSRISFNLHVDSRDGNQDILYKNILIPLKHSGPASTVIFKNTWLGSATRFSKLGRNKFYYKIPRLDGTLEPVEDIRTVTDLSGYAITEQELADLIEKRTRTAQSVTQGYSSISGYNPDKQFDNKLHNKYLSHIAIEDLHGLEVEQVVEWNPGDVIVFDRQHLHCAGSGHDVKYGITIFTTKDRP